MAVSKRMVTRTPTKIVYLDQKCWIDIAKLCYGEPSEEKKTLVKRILESSEKDQIIFPLSISHLEETMRIANRRHKDQLASLMAKLSKGYSLQPYISTAIKAEIENIVLRKVGLPTLDIRNFVLKKGISHLIGAKPELKFKKDAISSGLTQEIQRKLLDTLEDVKTIEFLLGLSPPKSLNRGIKKSIKEMENIRQELRNIKDNNLRWRVFLARNICDLVLPMLTKITIEYNLPRDFVIKRKPTLRDVNEFLDSIPTALCFFTLIFRRDQQFQRPIPENDFHDIWFLTLAIPYCDVVITENMWTAISKQAKLDEKCKTVVLSSINEFGKYL